MKKTLFKSSRLIQIIVGCFLIIATAIGIKIIFNNLQLQEPTDKNIPAEKFNTSAHNIILNAMPKSGSAYIAARLTQGLGYVSMNISAQYIPQDQVVYSQIRDFYEINGALSKQHLDASPLNLQILKRFTDRIVLQIRDPREVLLSWVHHLNKLHEEKVDVYYFTPEPPPGYYDLNLHEQIDWNIDNFLPAMVVWLNDWLALKQREDSRENGFKILLTTYNELLTDEKALYRKILAFYDIPLDKFTYTPVAKDRNVHYRKADPNEWREVFTVEQKQRIDAIVPVSILDIF